MHFLNADILFCLLELGEAIYVGKQVSGKSDQGIKRTVPRMYCYEERFFLYSGNTGFTCSV